MNTKYLLATACSALLVSTAMAPAVRAQEAKEPFTEFEAMELAPAWDAQVDTPTASAPIIYSGGSIIVGWEGVSQYNAASFGRNFIPPDTNGAVGLTQYMETTNGAYAVYNKSTGALQSMVSDVSWWAAAGQTGANGDTRIMYNAHADRWIVESFGSSTSQIQIAVSNTGDALGGWKSVKFTGYAGIADYPTLALDNNAVYIGTNNFTTGGSFRGTTLNVIPLDSLFNNTAPTVTNMKQFVTAYPGTIDRGYAIQGVNSDATGSTGSIASSSLFYDPYLTYTVNGLTTGSATGATLGVQAYLDPGVYAVPGAGRQPSVLNPRVIDTSDTRVSSSVYEVGGRTYMVATVDPGTDHAVVRYIVFDSATQTVLDVGDIGDATHDYYMGAIAVNALGQVVITYDRSGSDPSDGKISVMARTFKTLGNGTLQQTGSELLLHVSNSNDYHNGSLDGQAAAGRQRWGDYAQVSVDPGTTHGFYLIGEFAREPNNAANGHPGGTGGTRWGTWIAGITAGSVPEPASWAMMLAGFGFIGGALRRRRYMTA